MKGKQRNGKRGSEEKERERGRVNRGRMKRERKGGRELLASLFCPHFCFERPYLVLFSAAYIFIVLKKFD